MWVAVIPSQTSASGVRRKIRKRKQLDAYFHLFLLQSSGKIQPFVFSKKVSPSLSQETASPLLFLPKCSSMEQFPAKRAAGHQPGQTLLSGFTSGLLSSWISCFAPKYKPALMKHEELTTPAREHRKTHLAESRKPPEHVVDQVESRDRTGLKCLKRFTRSYLLSCWILLLYPCLKHRLTSPFIFHSQ